MDQPKFSDQLFTLRTFPRARRTKQYKIKHTVFDDIGNHLITGGQSYTSVAKNADPLFGDPVYFIHWKTKQAQPVKLCLSAWLVTSVATY